MKTDTHHAQQLINLKMNINMWNGIIGQHDTRWNRRQRGLSEEFVESQYNSSISKQIEETNLFTYE